MNAQLPLFPPKPRRLDCPKCGRSLDPREQYNGGCVWDSLEELCREWDETHDPEHEARFADRLRRASEQYERTG